MMSGFVPCKGQYIDPPEGLVERLIELVNDSEIWVVPVTINKDQLISDLQNSPKLDGEEND